MWMKLCRRAYVYATAEATATTARRANTWTRGNAVDQSRHRTQAEAFGKLVDAFAQSWEGVLAEHGPAAQLPADAQNHAHRPRN